MGGIPLSCAREFSDLCRACFAGEGPSCCVPVPRISTYPAFCVCVWGGVTSTARPHSTAGSRPRLWSSLAPPRAPCRSDRRRPRPMALARALVAALAAAALPGPCAAAPAPLLWAPGAAAAPREVRVHLNVSWGTLAGRPWVYTGGAGAGAAGPPVVAREGDVLVVTVRNGLRAQPLSLHHHGLPQRGTPWYDGVGGVTQPPVPPGKAFTYRVAAAPPGTALYHGHWGLLAAEGLAGLVVVQPRDARAAVQHWGLPEVCACGAGVGGFGTRPWGLALLACGGAYWPLAFEPSAMTSRHLHYCGHPPALGGGGSRMHLLPMASSPGGGGGGRIGSPGPPAYAQPLSPPTPRATLIGICNRQ